MAIDTISPLMGATRLMTISNPPGTTIEARESASPQNGARRVTESRSGASPAYLSGPQNTTIPVAGVTLQNVRPAPSIAGSTGQGALAGFAQAAQAAQTQEARQSPHTGQAGETNGNALSGMRSASEAYRAETTARSEQARREQQQASGSQMLNILA